MDKNFPAEHQGHDTYTLACPSCGATAGGLHHGAVDVYEDRHVVIDADQVTVDDHMRGNPSSYRNGLSVLFFCEQCPAISRLDIAQHKGETYLEFKQVGASSEPNGPESSKELRGYVWAKERAVGSADKDARPAQWSR